MCGLTNPSTDRTFAAWQADETEAAPTYQQKFREFWGVADLDEDEYHAWLLEREWEAQDERL
jgi:hypothetical protein